jgi:hypothetical protein
VRVSMKMAGYYFDICWWGKQNDLNVWDSKSSLRRRFTLWSSVLWRRLVWHSMKTDCNYTMHSVVNCYLTVDQRIEHALICLKRTSENILSEISRVIIDLNGRHKQHWILVQRLNKIMETLRNWEMEFVLVTLEELQLETMNVLPFVYSM